MARTTAAAVKLILDTSLSDAVVEAFMDDASAMVTEVLGAEGLGDSTLGRIEKYLAAHLCTLHDRRVASETAGGTSLKYQGATGMALESSLYGQQAMLMDATGKLSSMNSEQRRAVAFRASGV